MTRSYAKCRFWICLCCVLLGIDHTVIQAQVVVNEVMFNPSGSEFFDEYIELYNAGEVAVDLTGWRVGDGEDTDGIVGRDVGLTLGSGQYALILDADYFERSQVYDPLPQDVLILTIDGPTFGNGGLHNSTNEHVVLIAANGDTVSSLMYLAPNASGISEEKIDSSKGDSPENWTDAKWEGGTPGRVNSVSVKRLDLALRPRTVGADYVPWMEVGTFEIWAINMGLEAIGQFQIRVKGFTGDLMLEGKALAPGDSTRIIAYEGTVLGGGHLVYAEGVLEKDEDLTNQSTTWIVVGGYPTGLVVINEVMAAPSVGEEWIELLNVGEDPVRLDGWVLRDARTSAKIEKGNLTGNGLAIFSNDSERIKISDPTRLPTLNNGGDVLELVDATGSVIDRVAYPAATTDVSLERIDPLALGTDLANWLNSTVGATPGLPNSVKAVQVDTVSLVADPNPFETETRIQYQLPVLRAHVNLWIFDREGRKVRTLLSASEAGAQREIMWDGRDDGEQFLKPGVFVLYLEARSADGQVFRAKTAVAFVRGINN